MAAPLIITENNGLKRTIALQGRSLPYKGAVLVEDEQRVEITFFPGNPVAYAQILGPQLTRTVFNGTWKDKYLQLAENAPRVLNFPTVSAAGQPLQPGSNLITGATFTSAGAFPGTQDLRLAKTVRDAFRLLCRSGQQCEPHEHASRPNRSSHAPDGNPPSETDGNARRVAT